MNLNHRLGPLFLDVLEIANIPMLGTADALPARPGAYLLLMEIGRPIELAIPTLTARQIPAGWYVYAGNAYGPGGIRARARRHLRRNKNCHWHVDQLTTEAESLFAAGVPDGNECDLIRKLLSRHEFVIAATGFGSSDCRDCQAHLLSVRL